MKQKDIKDSLIALFGATFKSVKGCSGITFDYNTGCKYVPPMLLLRFHFGDFTIEGLKKAVEAFCERIKQCAVGTVDFVPDVRPYTYWDGGDIGVQIWVHLEKSTQK